MNGSQLQTRTAGSLASTTPDARRWQIQTQIDESNPALGRLATEAGPVRRLPPREKGQLGRNSG